MFIHCIIKTFKKIIPFSKIIQICCLNLDYMRVHSTWQFLHRWRSYKRYSKSHRLVFKIVHCVVTAKTLITRGQFEKKLIIWETVEIYGLWHYSEWFPWFFGCSKMHHISFIIHVEFHLVVPETRPRQPQGKITLKSSKDYIKLVDTGKLPETK